MAKLTFSRMNVLLQFALDYADTGEMPDFEFRNEDEKVYFDRTVAEIMEDRANGHDYEYSVGDYDDEEP